MISTLFCTDCDKEYKVDLSNIKLMQKFNPDYIYYSEDRYFYKDDCFFKTLNKIKKEQKIV